MLAESMIHSRPIWEGNKKSIVLSLIVLTLLLLPPSLLPPLFLLPLFLFFHLPLFPSSPLPLFLSSSSSHSFLIYRQNILQFVTKYGEVVSFRFYFKAGTERAEPRGYCFAEFSTREVSCSLQEYSASQVEYLT